MQITVPKHLMIKTICQNWVKAGIIREDEVEPSKTILVRYSIEDIAVTLIHSHMFNPLNLEQHKINFISEN